MACEILNSSREHAILPDWMGKYLVPDAAFVRAYDVSAPLYRASLKTALALHTFIETPSNGFEFSSREGYRKGFRETASYSPAPWAAIVFPDDYKAAARIFSAAVLALLADCGVCFALCVGMSSSARVLAALELCGMENVFVLSRSKTLQVLTEMTGAWGAGRVVILDSQKLSPLDDHCRELGVILYEENDTPRLLLPDPENFSLPILELAQGFIPPRTSHKSPLAVYSARPREEIPGSPFLLLRPGLECFWRFEGLTAEFFINRRFSYSTI